MSALLFWVLEYLLNSLWMLPVVFAAAWLITRMVRRVGPQAEHTVWVGALLLEVVLPACRIPLANVVQTLRAFALAWWNRGATAGDGHVSVTTGPAYAYTGLAMPRQVMVWVASIYAGITFYFVARLLWGVWRTLCIERGAKQLEVTGSPSILWRSLCSSFGVNGAAIAESDEVAGPVTTGVYRGTLLIPCGFLDRVQGNDLEAVMAHECAHICRHDFIKNLLYNVALLPVAYHPVAWLTLARIAESREMVCDAMAADALEGRETYARSLLRLASMVIATTPAKTLHAIGIFDANTFERRVMRLTGRKLVMGRGLRLATITACIGIGALTCVSALALRMEVAGTASAPPENNRSGTMKVSAGVMAANVIFQKPPVYPADAKANKDTVDGPVVMEAIISKEGVIENLRVKQSLRADYDRSAIDAVREWRYKPYLLNGEPVEVETTITVNFSIGK
jgi:TonB family protein